MPTWIAGQDSEVAGYADPFNLPDSGVAFSPDSQEGDATAFLTAIANGDTVRIEKDASNFREGIVASVSFVSAHHELTWISVSNTGSFSDDDILTVTHTPASSPAGSNIMLLGAA